jgi:hypothetical protein
MCAEIDGLVIKEKELQKGKVINVVREVKETSSAQRDIRKKKDRFCVSFNSKVCKLGGKSCSLLSWCTPGAPQTPTLVDDARSLGLCTCVDLTFMGPCIVSIFQYISNKMQRYTVYLYLEIALCQCFSNFVIPRPGKFFFHKTRARSQQIYS